MRPGLTALSVVSIAAGGCNGWRDGPGPDAAVADVIVRPAAVRIRAGEAAQLLAQVNDSTGRPIGGAELSFSTSTPRMVRVSPAGAISAVGPTGDGLITVSSGSTHRQVPVAISAGVASTARLTSGGGQQGEAGTTLPEPIVVTLTDAFGNAVSRADVRFDASGGGSIDPDTATTDATGVARVVWTLGETAGPQTLTASVGDASAAVEALAVSGRMASIEPVGVLARRVSAGDSVLVRLRAADRHGNGVSAVVMAFSVAGGGGSVAPARVETGADGLAQTQWLTGTDAGINVLAVRAIDVRDTTIRIDVRTHGGAPAAARLVRGGNQRAAVGAAVPVAPIIRVVDQYGNDVSTARVRFLASSGSIEPAEAVTDDEGRVTVQRWVLGAPGLNTLSVLVDGVADTLRVTATARPR
jgi:adhesin/invasin